MLLNLSGLRVGCVTLSGLRAGCLTLIFSMALYMSMCLCLPGSY